MSCLGKDLHTPMVGRAYCSRILIICSCCFLNMLLQVMGKSKFTEWWSSVPFIFLHVTVIQPSFMPPILSLFFCIALVDVSLFTATKTPRVSAAWSAGFHFSPFPSPYTSKAWSIPGHLSKAITNCPLAR